jgi:hypothetical protein
LGQTEGLEVREVKKRIVGYIKVNSLPGSEKGICLFRDQSG